MLKSPKERIGPNAEKSTELALKRKISYKIQYYFWSLSTLLLNNILSFEYRRIIQEVS